MPYHSNWEIAAAARVSQIEMGTKHQFDSSCQFISQLNRCSAVPNSASSCGCPVRGSTLAFLPQPLLMSGCLPITCSCVSLFANRLINPNNLGFLVLFITTSWIIFPKSKFHANSHLTDQITWYISLQFTYTLTWKHGGFDLNHNLNLNFRPVF